MQCNINIIVRVAHGGGRQTCYIQHKNLNKSHQLLLSLPTPRLLCVCQGGLNFSYYLSWKNAEPEQLPLFAVKM